MSLHAVEPSEAQHLEAVWIQAVPMDYPRLDRELTDALRDFQHLIEGTTTRARADFLLREARRLERRIIGLTNVMAQLADRLAERT